MFFFHLQLPSHDITFEAAWPELFIDSKGKYWEVPESVSLDCLSLVSDSGLRYRFGLHKNSGVPKTVNSSIAEAPLALLPGFCAKAAFSYEKSKDLWRQKETKEDLIVETPAGKFFRPSYDVRLKEPHAAISGIIGNPATITLLFLLYKCVDSCLIFLVDFLCSKARHLSCSQGRLFFCIHPLAAIMMIVNYDMNLEHIAVVWRSILLHISSLS